MKNKKVRCEERNEKGFFERIKDSYFKASFGMPDLARAFKKQKYINMFYTIMLQKIQQYEIK